MLSEAGFAVTTAAPAAECQAAIATIAPSLIVLAILLPDLDGLALTRRLRTAGPTIPILIVSALLAERRALDAGATAFLAKPITAAVLVSVCLALLSSEVPV